MRRGIANCKLQIANCKLGTGTGIPSADRHSAQSRFQSILPSHKPHGVFHLQSAICNLQFAICNLQFAIP
jgi:hypothetical protein